MDPFVLEPMLLNTSPKSSNPLSSCFQQQMSSHNPSIALPVPSYPTRFSRLLGPAQETLESRTHKYSNQTNQGGVQDWALSVAEGEGFGEGSLYDVRHHAQQSPVSVGTLNADLYVDSPHATQPSLSTTSIIHNRSNLQPTQPGCSQFFSSPSVSIDAHRQPSTSTPMIPLDLISQPALKDDQEPDASWNLVPYNVSFAGDYGSESGSGNSSLLSGTSGPGGAGVFLRSPTPTKRQRTSQACEKCRDRKAKCNGSRPTCHRCQSRGLICEYAKERRMRGPNKGQLSITLGASSSRSREGSSASAQPGRSSQRGSPIRNLAQNLTGLSPMTAHPTLVPEHGLEDGSAIEDISRRRGFFTWSGAAPVGMIHTNHSHPDLHFLSHNDPSTPSTNLHIRRRAHTTTSYPHLAPQQGVHPHANGASFLQHQPSPTDSTGFSSCSTSEPTSATNSTFDMDLHKAYRHDNYEIDSNGSAGTPERGAGELLNGMDHLPLSLDDATHGGQGFKTGFYSSPDGTTPRLEDEAPLNIAWPTAYGNGYTTMPEHADNTLPSSDPRAFLMPNEMNSRMDGVEFQQVHVDGKWYFEDAATPRASIETTQRAIISPSLPYHTEAGFLWSPRDEVIPPFAEPPTSVDGSHVLDWIKIDDDSLINTFRADGVHH